MKLRLFIVTLILLLGLKETYAGTKFDSGQNTSVARVGDLIIEVHESEWLNTLWYKIGVIKNNKITWGKSVKYDNGVAPSITISENTIIEVHQDHQKSFSRIDPTPLVYRIGKLDIPNKKIVWGPSLTYHEDGLSPKVTIANNQIITSHLVPYLSYIETKYDKEGKESYIYHYYNVLHYYLGVLNSSSINWNDAGWYEERASSITNLNLASSNDTVVEVHSNESDVLSYRIGTINCNSIEWGKKNFYFQGRAPSVSISGNLIFEQHQCKNTSTLCYALGVIDNNLKNIQWIAENTHDKGRKPSVALQGNSIVETHKSPYFDSLYFNIGTINNEKDVVWH